MQFLSSHPHYEHLRTKWVSKHKNIADKFLDKHGETLRKTALGGMSGLVLLGMPGTPLLTQAVTHPTHEDGITKETDKNALLAMALKEKVPTEVRKLNVEEENAIAQVLTDKLGMVVKPEIDGIRLNRSYGLIGGEQHLYRYPGDTVMAHADNASDWAMYGGAGIAPGLGAWGYFAPSQAQFTEKDKQRERYYIAVQTFLAPGFAENVGKYRDFFKYRKMVLVNPKTGQAVVTVIGDAGPAEWTGKSLGGSPEVMEAVGLAKGPRKGPVLYYFIDDPNDQIPLGPIKLKGDN